MSNSATIDRNFLFSYFHHANHSSLIRLSHYYGKLSFRHNHVIDWEIYDFVVSQRASEVAFSAGVLNKISIPF